MKPSNIFHIQRDFSNNIEVVNPCYPAYASRNLYNDNKGFDFLILVEDVLCKYIVEKIIEKNNLYESKLYNVLPCGGWENIIKLHKEIKTSKLVANNCKIMTILDGDIKAEYDKKYEATMNNYQKSFLPIKSIEKYLKDKMVGSTPDSNFCKKFGDFFYKQRSLKNIVDDYTSRTQKDNDGKILFNVLKACAVEQGYTEETWKESVCQFIYDNENFEKLEDTLKKFFK